MISTGNETKAHRFLKPVGKITLLAMDRELWWALRQTEVKKIAILSLMNLYMVLMWTHMHCLVAPQPCLHTPYKCAHPLCTQIPSRGTHTCTLPQAWHGHMQTLCAQLFKHPGTFPAWVHAHTCFLHVYAHIHASTESLLSHIRTHTHMIYSSSSPLHIYSYQPSQYH